MKKSATRFFIFLSIFSCLHMNPTTTTWILIFLELINSKKLNTSYNILQTTINLIQLGSIIHFIFTVSKTNHFRTSPRQSTFSLFFQKLFNQFPQPKEHDNRGTRWTRASIIGDCQIFPLPFFFLPISHAGNRSRKIKRERKERKISHGRRTRVNR